MKEIAWVGSVLEDMARLYRVRFHDDGKNIRIMRVRNRREAHR